MIGHPKKPKLVSWIGPYCTATGKKIITRNFIKDFEDL